MPFYFSSGSFKTTTVMYQIICLRIYYAEDSSSGNNNFTMITIGNYLGRFKTYNQLDLIYVYYRSTLSLLRNSFASTSSIPLLFHL